MIMAAQASQVVIIGAGAIGAFYGALAKRAGARVTVVLRSDAEHVRQHGFAIASPMGDLSWQPDQVFDARDQPQPGADVVICCVKVLPGVDRAALIHPWLGPNSSIMLMENGLNIEAEVARSLPGYPLISAIAFVGVSRLGPGQIRHTAAGHLTLGNWPQGCDGACARLAKIFEAGGVSVRQSVDIQRERWAKSLWNAPINSIAVLADGTDTDNLLATAGDEKLVRRAMAEVMAAARADGRPMPDNAIDRNITATRRMPLYRNSMALDYRAGRPLELDAILGNVIAQARQNSVPVPVLETLYTLIAMRQREQQAGAQS